MSDKPVYQSLFIETEFHDGWRTIDKQTFEDRSKLVERYQVRILYPASAYEALQKENAELKRNITNALKERKHQEDSNIKLREESAAQAKRIAELETPLTHRQISSACLSFRHDFGLLEPEQQAALFSEAKSWEACFQKERDIAASKNGDSK